MAKLAFSKLGLKKQNQIRTATINDQSIEIKQYLPINEKLQLISQVINYAQDDNNFANPVKLDVFTNLEIIFYYTNLSFTEKQKEDLVKLYDLLEENNLFNQIIAQIPEAEYQMLINSIQECADAIYKYQNSLMGILDMVSADYSSLNLEATDIQKTMADPNTLGVLKDVLAKLG